MQKSFLLTLSTNKSSTLPFQHCQSLKGSSACVYLYQAPHHLRKTVKKRKAWTWQSSIHFETRFLHRRTWSQEGSYILCLKHSVGHFIAHPTITTLLSATDRGERAQNALTNLALAKGTRCIDLQPLIHTLLVEKMRTWQLSQLIIVWVFCQADATNLFNFTTLLVISSTIAGQRLPKK